MGTGFERDVQESGEGIIPRAVRHLFAGIEKMQGHPLDGSGVCLSNVQFSVAAQFMELYNEDIIDLLDPYNKVRLTIFGTINLRTQISFANSRKCIKSMKTCRVVYAYRGPQSNH